MKSFFRSLLIVTLLAAQSAYFATAQIFAQSPNQKALSQPYDFAARLAAIEKAVAEKQRIYGIPGIALAIVKDDQIIYNKGFGSRDLEKKLPVNAATLFAIGSSTKAFTAMATMMSVDDGKLSLDDSPKKFLPFFKLRDAEADTAVTLRDLMCHRTGLDRTDLSGQFPEKLTREDTIKLAGLAQPTAKFRQRFQYQNTMFTAAGETAAKANNTTWEKLVENRIFKPLGMTASNTSVTEMQKSKNFSRGYDYNPETREVRQVKTVDETLAAPAGAINSNTGEMTKWLRLMLGGGAYEGKRLVSEKNFRELVTEQMPIAPKLGYGLGWFLRDWRGRKEVDHGGNVEGFSTMVAMIPEEHLGLVMLSNVTYSPLQDEIREIVYANLLGDSPGDKQLKIAAETLPKTPASPAEISPALKEILGDYESERSGKAINIALKDNAVLFQLEGQPPLRLIEKSKDNFAVEGLPEGFILSIKRDDAGKMSGLAFNQQGIIANLRRVIAVDVNVEDLMKKVIEAAGGEANLRKHTSLRIEASVELEGEGMTGELSMNAKAPNLSASNLKYFAFGREVGANFDYFDGTKGVALTTSGKSIIATPLVKSGKILEDARLGADFYAPLNWKTLYQKVIVKKISKIGGEEVYVVEKIPAAGHPVTEYISTKSFLVLRRESEIATGYFAMTAPYVEDFSDFRREDGVVMPHKIVAGIPHSGVSVITIKSVQFNISIPKAMFVKPFAAK